jgi:hypothetical protein
MVIFHSYVKVYQRVDNGDLVFNSRPSNSRIRLSHLAEGSLEVKLPTIWTDEKQSREEAERRERLEERRVEEKE